jgi:hypothetical protein
MDLFISLSFVFFAFFSKHGIMGRILFLLKVIVLFKALL